MVPEVHVPCWHHYLDYLDLGLNGMVQDRLRGIRKFTLQDTFLDWTIWTQVPM